MLTAEQRKELDALKSKADRGEEETARMVKLESLSDAKEKTYDEAYVKKLREEAAKHRTKAKEYSANLANFDGIDPEEYRALKDAQEKLEENKLKDAGEFDILRQKLVDAHAAELTSKDTVVQELQSKYNMLETELQNVMLGHEIAVAASIAKAINPQLVEMVIKGTMAKVETMEDGSRTIKVLDTDGSDMVDAKTGKPVTISQLMEIMKTDEKYAHLFAGGKPGAGSGTVLHDGKRIDNPWKAETFNLTLQGQITQNNPALAAQLKAEAGK